MKSAQEHIPFLDYLRGIAILFVFLYHCLAPDFTHHSFQLGWNGWLRDFNEPLSRLVLLPAMLGWAGVPIFFVISGFCIHLSHAKSRDRSLTIFFLRRFFRIYPPYLAALLFFAFIFPWSSLDFSPTLRHTHSQFYYSMISLVAHATLTHNFSSYVAFNINGAFWSIAVEVQLYLLYPLFLLLARNLGWHRVLWITGVLEIALRSFSSLTGIDQGWLTLNPLYFWFSWSIGAALAEAYLKSLPLPFAGRSLIFYPLLLVVFDFVKPLSTFCFTLAALSTVHVMSHWLKHPEKSPKLAGPGWRARFGGHLRFVGVISYSLYLIHAPLLLGIFEGLEEIFPNGQISYLGIYTILALSWFLMLVPAYLFYRFLELPSTALGKWMIRRRRQMTIDPELVPPAPST